MRKMSQTTRNFGRLMKRITYLEIPLPFSDSALRFPFTQPGMITITG